jgi:molybdate transport system permease protein
MTDRGGSPLSALFLLAAAGGLLLLGVPLVGLLLRTPWARLPAILASESSLTALRLSLVVSMLAALLSLVLGFPLAWLLARTRLPGRAALRGLVVLPLVLPPVVAGVGLLAALGRRGILGGGLEALGVRLAFTTTAATVAATFVALPLMVLALEAGLRAADIGLEDAAATLGASPGFVLRHVTLPLLAPQVVAGLALAWARALGEFGATITFAGNVRGATQTLPLAVFERLQTDPDGAVALSLLLVVLAVGVLVGLRGRFLPAGGASA